MMKPLLRSLLNWTPRVIICMMMTLASLGTSPAHSQEANNSPNLQVRPTGAYWWIGNPSVPIKCTVTNTSSSSIQFLPLDVPGYAQSYLNINLVDKSGQTFPLTNGMQTSTLEPNSKSYISLSRGESYTFGLDNVVELPQECLPGTYRLQIILSISSTEKRIPLTVINECSVQVRNIKTSTTTKPYVLLPITNNPDDQDLAKLSTKGKCGIAERTKGVYWLAYWVEFSDPSQKIQTVTNLLWIGRVKKSAAFSAKTTSNNNVLIAYINIYAQKHQVMIKHFRGQPVELK